MSSWFPSPIGELYFSISEVEMNTIKMNAFPSPIGELYFSIFLTEVLKPQKLRKFPSPIGELYFSILYQREQVKVVAVSVPYRGAIFLNGDLLKGIKVSVNSFRPLSGSYISQSSAGYTGATGRIIVSVPYRGAIFLNYVLSLYQREQVSFRPLSGSYISQ